MYLEACGYPTVTAPDDTAALLIAETHNAPLDILIAKTSGETSARFDPIKALRPNIRVVDLAKCSDAGFSSGATDFPPSLAGAKIPDESMGFLGRLREAIHFAEELPAQEETRRD
jgi:hypothetical protein